MLARTALARPRSACAALAFARSSPTSPHSRRNLATASTLDSRPGHGHLRMILLGAPGAGKGTLSDWLIDKYDVDTVVVGQLLRNEILKRTQLGKTAESTMRAGGLLPDELVLEVVQPAVDALRDRVRPPLSLLLSRSPMARKLPFLLAELDPRRLPSQGVAGGRPRQAPRQDGRPPQLCRVAQGPRPGHLRPDSRCAQSLLLHLVELY